MRILLLSQVVPYPPDSGPKVKTYHVIRHLAECGHQVNLASFVRAHEEQNIEQLRPYCTVIHAIPLRRSRIADLRAYAASLHSGLPFLVTRDAISELQALVRRLAREQHFDIVHADQLTMAQYALEYRKAAGSRQKAEGGRQKPEGNRQYPQADAAEAGQLNLKPVTLKPETPIVFDAHNAVHSILSRSAETAPWFLRPFLVREARLVKQYEAKLIRTFDHTLAVSEQDKQALLKVASPEGRRQKAEGRADRPMSQSTNPAVPRVARPRDPADPAGPWRGLCEGLPDEPMGQTVQRLAVEGLESEILNLTSKIAIIPIAVDTSQLTPIRRVAESPTILTLGTLYYPPNADGVRWFIREVYPLVRAQVPDCTLTVIGPRPPRDIVALAAEPALSIPSGAERSRGTKGYPPRITLPGYVPDLVPYLERAALMVVPVRAGSGMRVRILEAFARGIPVVTTTTGVEGIEAVNGEHLLVADEPEAFAEAVVRLLRDLELGRRLAANGRRLVEEKYDWRVALPKLEAVYQSLCPNGTRIQVDASNLVAV